jgi:hypothetical protein
MEINKPNVIHLSYKKCIVCKITYSNNEYKNCIGICNHCYENNTTIDYDENEIDDVFDCKCDYKKERIESMSTISEEYDSDEELFNFEN